MEAIAVIMSVIFIIFTEHLVTTAAAAATATASVIVVGAGFSGISAAKTLSDAGIEDILILEATDSIGGRIRKTDFVGLPVEYGANWVEGVNGEQTNPIWEMGNKLNLRTFCSDYSNISSNIYKHNGGLYESPVAKKAIDEAEKMVESATNFSETLSTSGEDDISILEFQRLKNRIPSTPLDMLLDYYTYDYECAEPPRVTSLCYTLPLPTFTDYGDDIYFVADHRGFESLVYHVAGQFLRTSKNGTINDHRLKYNKVVRQISQFGHGVTITTEDGSVYKADYVMVSVSIGVLQTNLIKFEPTLPHEKIMAINGFSMAEFTKIFLKFPYKFWPTGNKTEFFLYASKQRGYYPIWKQLGKEFPEANILFVCVSDDESRRIEQQSDSETKAEAMAVLKSMFGEDIPDATDILVTRWWSDRFFRGAFVNWPIGVNKYEFDHMRAPYGRVYFTGEHTSELYNGYVHGAYLAGIDSANEMISCMKKGNCKI